MANIILTPVTLWRDFDETLPLEDKFLGEKEEGDTLVRELTLLGRKTEQGRVRIYAKYIVPAGAERFPVALVLFEAGLGFDDVFIRRLTDAGYGVLAVDYCGDNGTDKCTVYPADVDYANYVRAGKHMELADPDARATSWYEWAAVARYAARWLAGRSEVTAVGAIGLRTGGEVLFKVAPYAKFACFISVCAAGWLAYRGMEKFGGTEKRVFDEERHRFIAGLDSQSYAPYVNCPVLLLSAINDMKYDYDRVYDTFRQINPDVEKAILFSAHGNGLMGSHSMHNLMLFLDKYLRGHSVYVSLPIGVEVKEDGKGDLVADCIFDDKGEISEFGVFYTEKATGSTARDWTRVLGKTEDIEGNVGRVPLSVFAGGKKLLVYAFVKYSNNFSVTSKILDVDLEKPYANSRIASRVIYSNKDGTNGFAAFRRRARSVADCFTDGAGDVRLVAGYGGIEGITSQAGLISYRVSEPGYNAPEGAMFAFDVFSLQGASLKVIFYLDAEEHIGYTYETEVPAGGKWKNVLLESGDLKAETGAPLPDFSSVVSVVFVSDGEIVINNVLWM